MIQHGGRMGGAMYEQIRTKGLFLCQNREFIIETQYESHEAPHAPLHDECCRDIKNMI